jgi:hypothetical protein
MPIKFIKNKVVFDDIVSVEDAEILLEWLQNKHAVKVDLSACTHLHAANLQVLMAAKTLVASWPKDAGLRSWLETALKSA